MQKQGRYYDSVGGCEIIILIAHAFTQEAMTGTVVHSKQLTTSLYWCYNYSYCNQINNIAHHACNLPVPGFITQLSFLMVTSQLETFSCKHIIHRTILLWGRRIFTDAIYLPTFFAYPHVGILYNRLLIQNLTGVLVAKHLILIVEQNNPYPAIRSCGKG